MNCKICGQKLVQVSGWFLGGAKFECMKCNGEKPATTYEDNNMLFTRFVILKPVQSMIGYVAFGTVVDSQTNNTWLERVFSGDYAETAQEILEMNRIVYNGYDKWRLPEVSELLDLVILGKTPSTDFPNMPSKICFAKNRSSARNTVPVVDFKYGNAYHVDPTVMGIFLLIQ